MEERDFSSIKLLERVIQLVLPMRFVSDEFAGVLEILESWKRQYNPQLDGILVNYSNVSLMSRSNKVIISKSGIIIDVKAVFHLFCPKVGDVVKGKVNRISQELVGCIMHDTINATIYFTDYCPNELKKFIRIEREMLFEITFFSCYRNEVRVQGKITPDCLRMMTDLFPEVEEENLAFQSGLNHYNFLSDIEELPVFKTDVDIPLVNIDNVPAKAECNHYRETKKRKLDASPDGSKPIKKKRKKDIILPESNNVNDNSKKKRKKDVILPESNNVNDNSKKKRKKEKSKKRKIVATGTVVKSDKKKLNKEKHLKKKQSKKKDKKSKKSHKKEKHSDFLLISNSQIKAEI